MTQLKMDLINDGRRATLSTPGTYSTVTLFAKFLG